MPIGNVVMKKSRNWIEVNFYTRTIYFTTIVCNFKKENVIKGIVQLKIRWVLSGIVDRYCSSDGVLDIFFFLRAAILDLAKNFLPLLEPELFGMGSTKNGV
jgi:hypothetical protein